MNLGGSGVAKHFDQRPGGGAADQRIVDHYDSLASQVFGESVELQGHAALTKVLRRLDECAADVSILDQPIVVLDARFAAVSDGGWNRAVGHRNDDVGVDARLQGKLLAQTLAHVVHVAAGPHAVGSAEVHELERAAGRSRAGG